MSGHGAAELAERLDEEKAEAAALRQWIERHVPHAPILQHTSAGREMLTRLRIAEDVGYEVLVEGVHELRDSLALALSLVTVTGHTRGMFVHLRGVLNRWGGNVHLRLVGSKD